MNATIKKQQVRKTASNPENAKVKTSTRITFEDLNRKQRVAIVTIFFLSLENVMKNDLKTTADDEVSSPFMIEMT